MHHLVPTLFLLMFVLVYLALRYSVDAAFILTSPFPSAAYLIGCVHEIIVGSGPFNHRVLHIAYDSSYILVLFGLIILLRSIVRGNFTMYFVFATALASFPLARLLGNC